MELDSLVLRPIQTSDINSLCEVAATVGSGFTSLPNNKDFLQQRLELAVESFQQKNPPEERLYLLVMEDKLEGRFAGLCGIEAKVGNRVPFYNFKVSTVSQVCESLDIYLEHKVLQVVNDFQAATELVSLFLHPDYRGHQRGELLSRSRFLFIAQYPDWFSDSVIAEIRGISEKGGTSPFWEAVGRSFFAMDFNEADYLTMTHGKQFISDLLPRHPIYLDLLSLEAKEVIGQAHPGASPAKYLLENEGFVYRDYIDIFDGGPLISAERSSIRTFKDSQAAEVAECPKTIAEGFRAMLCSEHETFRLTVGQVSVSESGKVSIDSQTAEQLNVTQGDIVRYCQFQEN